MGSGPFIVVEDGPGHSVKVIHRCTKLHASTFGETAELAIQALQKTPKAWNHMDCKEPDVRNP